jgi:hypothetical protein
LLDRIDATRRLAHLAIACGVRSPASGLPGWRRSVDRTSLQLNSLLTGNFTGKITISGLKAAVLEQETAVPQRLFSKFPRQTIREIFPDNREFQADNRDSGPNVVFGEIEMARQQMINRPSFELAISSGSSRNTAHNFKRFAKTCETPC